MEKWYEVLDRSYRSKAELSREEMDLLWSFSTYPLFTMLPLLEKRVQAQLNGVVERKDRQIAEIYDSLSWRITAPLRKVFDLLFK